MSQEPGDRKFGHADQITRYNDTGNTIERGMWVVPTGNDNVGKSDVGGAGGALTAVTSDPHENGEHQMVHVRGVVLARVDSAVVAGNELGAPDSGGTGTAGVADSGGSSGIYALEDAVEYGSSGNYYAPCLIR